MEKLSMKAMIRFLLGSTLMVLLGCAVVFAQEAKGKSQNGQNTADAAAAPAGVYWTPQPGQSSYVAYGQPAQAASIANQFAKTDKENETQRAELRKRLMQLLTQEFDEHAQQQKKELEILEAQIANLKSQLRKRLDAKDKIIERRFDQLVEEAEGLGWNVPGRSQAPMYMMPSSTNFTAPAFPASKSAPKMGIKP
jgi:hypothetical protein